MFSKKATKIDEIFTVVWHYISVKSTLKIWSIFVAFLENTNFNFEDSKFWNMNHNFGYTVKEQLRLVFGLWLKGQAAADSGF